MQDLFTSLEEYYDFLVTQWNTLPDYVPIIVYGILYLFLLFFTLRISRLAIDRYSDKLTDSTHHSLRTLVRFMVFILFGVGFLNQFPQFSGSIIGLSALLGTAIGFASTQTIGNMISGIYLMISRPFLVGDYVILPKMGFEGIVQEISINYTKLVLPNGTSTIITNRALLNTPVTNTRLEIVADEPQEVKEKEKNDDSESFDVKDMENELKHFYKKFKGEEKSVVYVYPINFSIAVGEKQESVNQALNKLEKYLENSENVEGVKDMSWRMLSRSRVEIKYEINIMVEKSYQIFRIVNTALNQLEIFLEEMS